jgi:hypothetical protein
MSDPVSWLLIEPGWKVMDADGEEVGQVEEVIGDRDIFSGLAVSTSLFGSPRWVASEDVDEITDDHVRLRLRGDQVKQLEEHEPPAPA